MSVLLEELMIEEGNSIFHTPEYMLYIRSHLLYLKANSGRVELDAGLVYKFEYNFYSLLVELKYPFEDFVVLLIVNGFNDPIEMTKDFRSLLVPAPEVVSRLKSLYRHQNKRI